MCNNFDEHFVKMARISHKHGMQLMRQGLPGAAFAKFVERDYFMQRARG